MELFLSICLVLLASSSYALDRNIIRQQLLARRLSKEVGFRLDSSFSADLLNRRARRQAGDYDFDPGSGSDNLHVVAPPPSSPTLPENVQTSSSSDWIWYRSDLNFLDSIEMTENLRDYHTDEFKDLASEIMVLLEDYLTEWFNGYLEATPLMFGEKRGNVILMVDVGTCVSNSADDITAALVALVRGGSLGRFRLSPEQFKIKYIATDFDREECQVLTAPTVPQTTTVFVTDEFDATTRSTTTAEPTPPDDLAVYSTPGSDVPQCGPGQATCKNLQCIDRLYVCDGTNDCYDGSDEDFCSNSGTECDPTQFLCNGTAICAQKHWRCDGDDDCGNGFDELDCPSDPNSACPSTHFLCGDGSCIPGSYHCDKEDDCLDASDEVGCSAPVVIVPPASRLEANQGETVTMRCEAVGTPTPVISWRVNWGNVPPGQRVSMTSKDGLGVLTIRKVKPSDQGAYTCEALNRGGAILAVPDLILTVNEPDTEPVPTAPPTPAADETEECPPGEFDSSSDSTGRCKRCYCFGVTDQCHSSNLEFHEVGITFDDEQDDVLLDLEPAEIEGGVPGSPEPINSNQITVNPAAKELQLIDLSKRFLAAAHYWSLPAQFLGAKINSYGGTLQFSFSYNNSYNFPALPTNNSDVILQGNGETLVYREDRPHPGPVSKHTTTAVFDEDKWTKPDGSPVTRDEMMNTLGNISGILLRTAYDNSMLSTGIGNVSMQVAQPAGMTATTVPVGAVASTVEECVCPEGYTGLSCEECDSGYERQMVGPYVGECLRTGAPIQVCKDGYTGVNCSECAEGYSPYKGGCTRYPGTYCDVAGSIGVGFGQTCQCKEGCQGPRCNKCKPGHYFLSEANAAGCLTCFCMGVTDQCNSTTWNRLEITANYDSADHFVLTNAAATESFQDDISFVTTEEEIRQPLVRANLDRLPRDVYYWMLPQEFVGKQLASYGGHLDYTIRYSERPGSRPISRIADLRLTGNGQTLTHVSGSHPSPDTNTRFVANIKEDSWEKADGTTASREDLLMVLSNVESFLVRATYSNQMIQSIITNIYLTSAAPRQTGRDRAYEVEECRCPVGYAGLSCEECTSGFYRVRDGPYLGTCRRCNCHGHSDVCDRETGVCQGCRDNTVGDHCEFCAYGFYGDARAGGLSQCQLCPCPNIDGRSDQGTLPTCTMGRNGRAICDQCPVGYEGDRCERCAPGYVGNPLIPGSTCRRATSNCNCDENGSVDNACDSSGQCRCKESTRGSKCDECKPGFFHLSLEHDGGCLPCFCMGLTRQCTSAFYERNKVTSDFNEDNGGFSLTNRQLNAHVSSGFEVTDGGRSLSYPRVDTLTRGITYYWRLPEEYKGDKIVSYGGKLDYTVTHTTYGRGSPSNEPDVILRGNDIVLHSYISGDVIQNVATERSTVFQEKSWRRADGQPATREHLLMALADLEEVLIKASYSTTTMRATITSVSMETASESVMMNEPSLEIEHCVCPDGYEGLSCEDCAPGFTRSGGGIYLGLCTACQCSGHAELCDTETGECHDCRNNRAGSRCEDCAPGYFGNPDVDNGCRPCACPGIGDNSFSDTCDYDDSTNALTCTACREGYVGTRCESCATGYVGEPTAPGGSCVRIEDNPGSVIDSSDLPRVTVSPRNVNANSGDTVTLRCTVSSRWRVRLNWQRSGKNLPVNAIVANSGKTLTLPTFDESSAGIYECVAANRYGTASDTSVVTLAKPGAMISVHVEEPRQLTVKVGSEVSFVCTASSKEPEAFIVTWMKQDGRLPLSRATDFDGILHITDARLSDSGTYVCTGSSMYDTVYENATLRVVEADNAATPVVVVTPNNQSVMKGDDVIFYCNAEGYPDPEVHWHRVDGSPMPENVHMSGHMLMIPSASMHDRALYMCIASNQHGTAEATGALEVFDGIPPTVTVVTPEVSVIIDESVILRCTATGEPTPTFSWVKLGRLLPPNSFVEGGNLRIESAVTNNAGVYQCIATNTFGQDSGYVRVDVLPQVPAEKPICRTEPQEVTAYVGTNSTSTCFIGGNPLPSLSWEREDGQPLDSNIIVQASKLHIIDVQKSNAGRYVCVATSAGGVTKSRMTLSVVKKDLPHVTVTPARSQRVNAGDRVQFTCHTNESDADVTWLRSDHRPFSGQTSLSGGNRVITFDRVTVDESGYYVCVAGNAVGHREVMVYMEVLRKPVIRVLPARFVTLRDGESVALKCMADGNSRPSVIWKKLNATRGGLTRTLTRYRQASSTLEIDRATDADAGHYMCMAINNAGRSQMEIRVMVHPTSEYVAPRVTVGQSMKHVTAGSDVQLRCVASGLPAPVLTWSKANQQLPTGSRQSEGILHIPNFNVEDVGQYECKAANELGMDVQTVDVDLHYPPSLSVKPSSSISLALGQSANVTCFAIAGTPPIAFSWHKNAGVASSVLTAGGLMQVTSFDPASDVGVYTCTGVNDAGSSTTTFTITEANPPVIRVHPSSSTKTTGEFVEFQCTVNGDALDVDLSWSRGGGLSLPADRALANANGRLVIEDLHVDDAGSYECHASNAAGTTSAQVTLIVQDPPTPFIDLIGNEDILIEGREYQIFCNSTGIPEPEVTLFKGENQLETDPDGMYTISGTSADSGTYSCVATNAIGTARDSLDVNIHGPPGVRVTPSTQEVRAHETLTMHCLVNTTLESNITWSKMNGEISPNISSHGHVLNLGNAQPEYSGVYMCSVSNLAGTGLDQGTVVVHSYIPFFSQTERSYLGVHVVPATLYTSFTVKISFRPNSLNGLLMYAYGKVSDFISLNLADGYLEFRFDVGSGSATIRSSTTAVIGEWHTVVVSRAGKTGKIQLDGGEIVEQKSPGEFRGLDISSLLYVGGLPRELDGRLPREIQSLGMDLGFYGCISQLEVNSEVIDMGSPEVDRVGIVRCKTCGADQDDSPCYNSGVCAESYNGKAGFACSCPSGVLGDNCQFIEKELCKPGSCEVNGVCERDLGRELGYRCNCKPGWVGPRCATSTRKPNVLDGLFDVIPDRPTLESKGKTLTMNNVTSKKAPAIVSFNKESYMMSKSVQASLPQRTDITMRIKRSSRSNGVLLFNRDESNGTDQFSNYHFVSLAFRNNALEFRFSWGSETAVLKSPMSVIGVGSWHVIRATRRRGKGKLEVDGRTVAKARASGFGFLGLTGPMYVGGVRFWDGIYEKVYVHDGFDGCLSQLKVNKKVLKFGKKFVKKNVGTCTNQVESVNNDILSDMQPSNLLLPRGRTSARFIRNSYASFHRSSFLHDGAAEQITFRFRSLNPEGLILFHGEDLKARQESTGAGNNLRHQRDFISIGLQAGHLVYSFNLGGGTSSAQSAFPVVDGLFHKVIVVRRGSLALMWIDDLVAPTAVQSASSHNDANTPGRVYLGGAPDVSGATAGRYSSGFAGCLRDVRLTSVSEGRSVELGSRYLDDAETTPLDFSHSGALEKKNLRACRREPDGVGLINI